MAIQPLITAWAHVRVMLKRRLLAQVLLDETGELETLLPSIYSEVLDRAALAVPRPRFIVQYPAHYVTYFDPEVARLVRLYLDALEDYAAELARGAPAGDTPLQPSPRDSSQPEDPLWQHVRRLKRTGNALRTALQELAGKQGGKLLLKDYRDAAEGS